MRPLRSCLILTCFALFPACAPVAPGLPSEGDDTASDTGLDLPGGDRMPASIAAPMCYGGAVLWDTSGGYGCFFDGPVNPSVCGGMKVLSASGDGECSVCVESLDVPRILAGDWEGFTVGSPRASAVEADFRCLGCVSPPAGMLGWWTFDEGTGDTYARDLSRNAADVPNGHDGAKAGTPVTGDGRVADALTLDGRDDHVDVPDANPLDIANGDFSVDVWVKIGTTRDRLGTRVIVDKLQRVGSRVVDVADVIRDGTLSHYHPLVAPSGARHVGVEDVSVKPASTLVESADGRLGAGVSIRGPVSFRTPIYRGYSVYLATGRPALLLADGTSSVSLQATSAVPADGAWHLVAVTVDRDSPIGVRFYVDGVFVGSGNPTAVTGSVANDRLLRIGAYGPDRGRGGRFAGSLDELELFGRVLGADEVGELYEAGFFGKCRPEEE